MKRKKLNVFSLSFLDIITCGLGAIILLFVLVNAKSAAQRDTVTSELRSEVNRVENQVLEGKKRLIQARNVLEKTQNELVKTQGLSRQVIKIIKESRVELGNEGIYQGMIPPSTRRKTAICWFIKSRLLVSLKSQLVM